MHDRANQLVQYFETLNPARVARMDDLYAQQVWFKDPFNEVQGLAKVQQIFSHMYVALDRPRFVVTECIVEDHQCSLTWDFEFHFKGRRNAVLQTIRGSSHLKFNASGLVVYHRDYWDAAEELYEKLPLLGSVMRWLKKKVKP